LKEQAQEYKVKYPLHDIFIGGDFNARHPLWGDTENGLGKEVVRWLDDQDMTILNKFPCPPTFKDSRGHHSWIDLSLLTDRGLVLEPKWEVVPDYSGFTDHNTVKTTLLLERKPQLTGKMHNWRKADWMNIWKSVEALLNNPPWDTLDWEQITKEDLDETISRFSSDLLCCTKKWVPSSRRSTYRKPWWSEELSLQHRKTKRAFRKAERTKNQIRKSMVMAEAKRERKDLKRMIRQAKRTAWINFVTEKPRTDLWKTFKRVTRAKASSEIAHIKKQDGSVLTDPGEIMDELASQFFPNIEDRTNPRSATNPQYENSPSASAEEVKQAVFRGKPYGAPGTDELPNILYRRLFPILGESLTGICNAVLRLQQFPKLWKIAKVVTIPKPSGGYRPISLLNTMSKMVEALLSNRFAFKMERKLHPSQHGFRKQKSTQSALLSLMKKLEESISRKEITYAASLDISAAFDSVAPNKLVQSAEDLELPPCMVKLIKSFTSDRQAILTVGGISKTYRTRSGTPQGSPWSPSLFTMYLNSVFQLDMDRRTSIQAFADDIFITATGNNDKETQAALQATINKVKNWSEQVKLRLNPKKCSAIKFTGRKQNNETLPVFLDGEQLKSNSTVKYLGVWLDSKLSFKPHLEAMARKCMHRLTEVKKFAKLYWGTDPKFLATFIKKAIEPAIYYGSACLLKSVHLTSNLTLLHRAVRKCGIFISGCLRTTPYNSVHLLSGLRDPTTEIESRALSQTRLFKAYGFSDLVHPETGKSQYVPPEDFSFTAHTHVEARRLKRLTKKDVLEVTGTVPWGIPPENNDLLISPMLEEPAPSRPRSRIHAHALVHKDHDKMRSGWAISQNGSYISDSYAMDKNRCRDSTELYGILQALFIIRPLVLGQDTAADVILHITSKVVKHLTRTSNINALAYKAQTIISEIKQSGSGVFWNTSKKSQEAQDLSRTIQYSASQSDEQQTASSEIGWDKTAFDLWRRKLADNKVRTFCQEYDAGKSLKSAGLQFSTHDFPASTLPRHEGSQISQFLSNHFPCKQYLHRFHLSDNVLDNTCNCSQAEEDRDHLLFDCALLAEARSELISSLKSELSWKNLLDYPAYLVPFVKSIAKLWSSQGRKWTNA